jgi:hypothetical protein
VSSEIGTASWTLGAKRELCPALCKLLESAGIDHPHRLSQRQDALPFKAIPKETIDGKKGPKNS